MDRGLGPKDLWESEMKRRYPIGVVVAICSGFDIIFSDLSRAAQ